MFAPGLLGCRGTIRQRLAPGGSPDMSDDDQDEHARILGGLYQRAAAANTRTRAEGRNFLAQGDSPWLSRLMAGSQSCARVGSRTEM